MSPKPNGSAAHHDPAALEALIETLKPRVSLAQVMRDAGVELVARGNGLFGLCCFHADEQPSLSVTEEEGLFQCFGCRTAGDVITFLRLKEGLSFPQAVERLQSLAGAAPTPPVETPRAKRNGRKSENDELPGGASRGELLGRVAELYAAALREHSAAQEYLKSRGLGSPDLWKAFGLGFCDGSLLSKVPREGPQREALAQLGVINAKGREHFLGCVVVPLWHADEGVVGLYGRRIAESECAHMYLPGRQRGALNWQAFKLSPRVVLAESVLDALSLWMAGCLNVSCLYGAQNLPLDVDELLRRFGTREVCFCLDADEPGRLAAAQLADTLAKRGVRCFEVPLVDAKDPNEVLVRQGPAALRAMLEQARPMQAEATDAPPAVREETGDGFQLHFSDVTWRVTPLPPFSGRLRVTLRVRCPQGAETDSLNLYSHRARAELLKNLHQALKLPKDEMERQLAGVMEQAEAWAVALEAARTADNAQLLVKAAPPLSDAERAEALAFLRRPDLVDAILADMEALGYVGEEHGKLLAYLISISRRLDKPLSGIVLSQSGAGKSCLTDLIEQLTPPEDVCMFSRVSTQVLGYMPKEYLKRKLLILEERAGGESADYLIRTLQSRQKISQIITVRDAQGGKPYAQLFEVEGPIAYLETTTQERLNEENTTRCFELGLDESSRQTQRIHQMQRQARSRDGIQRRWQKDAVHKRHHDAQRLLDVVAVEIPYQHLLSFPARWLRTRRDNERFLSLIEAVACLHQHQRLRTKVEDVPHDCIQATPADYRLAYELSKDILGVTLHELSRSAQELWEHAHALVCDRSEGRDIWSVTFIRRELRDRTHWPDRRLREAVQELVDMEYVTLVSGSQGRTCTYRLQSNDGHTSFLGELTSPEQLEALLAQGESPPP